MLLTLTRQDLSRRFTGNALGVAWAVLAPILQLLLFAFVFIHIFRARSPGLDETGYVVFLALGMWPWFAFSEAVARGSNALIENAGLLDKTALPKWALVGARVLAAFAVHGVGFLVVLLVMAALYGNVHWQWLPLTLPAWLALAVLAFGLALALAVCNVFLRDVQQITPFVLTALMFLSPILYDASAIPLRFQAWLAANPLTGLLQAIRAPLLRGDISPVLPGISFLFVFAILLAGIGLYRRFDRRIADFL